MSAVAAFPLPWTAPVGTTIGLRRAAGRATIAWASPAPAQFMGTPLQDEDGAGQKGAADIPRMAAIAAGDERAFASIVDETSGRLLRFARSMLGSAEEAEDAVQETFLRLYERAAEWRPDARIGTWLHRVCYNNCIDRLRRRRPQADPAVLAGIEDERPLAEAGMVAAEAAAGVRAAIASLPERQRSALLLFHFQELTQREAADVMAVSEDAFESLLSRARRQLRRALTEPQLPAKGDDHD